MNEQKLKRTLAEMATTDPERTRECPDEHVLAAIASGERPAKPDDTVSAHVSDCAWCLAQIADVLRSDDESMTNAAVDAATLAAARRLPERRRPAARRLGGLAVAAVLVLSAVVVVLQGLPPTGPSPAGAERTVRSIDARAMTPDILAPRDGEALALDGGTVRWSAVEGSLYYDIRVVDADGALLHQARLEGTEWSLPAGLALNEGEEYFVRVDAYLAEARRVSSRHVAFVAEGDR